MKPDNKLILENLTTSQKEIADIIGADNYLKLVQFVNGDSIYIPKYSELLRPCIDEEIRDKFDGYNFKELAAEYDLTVKSVYNKIPQELRVDKRNSPIEGQVTF